VADTLILPLAEELLTCLCAALTAEYAADPELIPAQCCLRAGDLLGEDIGIMYDECCAGLAYVNIENVYPTGSPGAAFPSPDTDAAFTGCGPTVWGATLTMAVMRCAPGGDANFPATCTNWEAAAALEMRDLKAMRAALCCFIDRHDPGDVAGGQSVRRGSEGGCLGRVMTIQVMTEGACGC
jgi:hypothetical protein